MYNAYAVTGLGVREQMRPVEIHLYSSLGSALLAIPLVCFVVLLLRNDVSVRCLLPRLSVELRC